MRNHSRWRIAGQKEKMGRWRRKWRSKHHPLVFTRQSFMLIVPVQTRVDRKLLAKPRKVPRVITTGTAKTMGKERGYECEL